MPSKTAFSTQKIFNELQYPVKTGRKSKYLIEFSKGAGNYLAEMNLQREKQA
jgi:hypothetical protein